MRPHIVVVAYEAPVLVEQMRLKLVGLMVLSMSKHSQKRFDRVEYQGCMYKAST